MPTYIFHPGNHVIHYPEFCLKAPADLPSFLAEMEPSFHDLLSKAEHGQSPDMIIEAFIISCWIIAAIQCPYWQTWTFGPCKWPYGKWALDKLRWFIADPAKLLDVLAELERAKEREASILQPRELCRNHTSGRTRLTRSLHLGR